MKNNPSQFGAAVGLPGGNFRWAICSLLFFSVAVNYIDRLVLAILKQDLRRDLGWNDANYDWIAAAFLFAYAFVISSAVGWWTGAFFTLAVIGGVFACFSGRYLLSLLALQLLVPRLGPPRKT